MGETFDRLAPNGRPMAVVSRESFGRLLASMDGADLAALAADLWSARGHETTVEGSRVVIDDGTVIRCVPSRGRRGPDSPIRDPDVDVVVTAREAAETDRSVPGDRPRVVDPEGLRGMLLYGVDRETASGLFETHFDRPITVEAATTSPVDGVAAATGRPLLGLVLLVAIAVPLAVAAGAGVGGPPADDPGPTVPAMPVPSATPSPSPVESFDPPAGGGSLFRYPPGVGPSGVTDPAALAAAHREAVSPAPWDLLLIYRGSADLVHPDRRWVSSRQTVDRSTDTRYWFRVTGLARTGADSFEPVIYDDFGDDRYNYRRTAGAPAPRYRRTHVPSAGDAGVFTAVSAAYVRRYLSTTQTRVEVVPYGVTNRYRVVATGTPLAIQGPVKDYRAVAAVDRRGLVYRLEVAYTRPGTSGSGAATATPPPVVYPGLTAEEFGGSVRFRMVFRDVGDATVGVPSWYEAARNATNGTPVDPWPTDPAV